MNMDYVIFEIKYLLLYYPMQQPLYCCPGINILFIVLYCNFFFFKNVYSFFYSTCRRCYIRFIRKTNEKKGAEGLEETKKAFDFMLSYVGMHECLET